MIQFGISLWYYLLGRNSNGVAPSGTLLTNDVGVQLTADDGVTNLTTD